MRSTLILTLTLTGVFCSVCHAEINCEPLRPNPPRNISRETAGKIDLKVDTIFKKFANAGGTIDGAYIEVSDDVLKEYPNADKLYMWDRLIYLTCENIRNGRGSDAEKQLNNLMDRIGRPPQ
jgi:hypothetical protein